MNCLIFTASYNEAENIERLIQEIRKVAPGVDVLVIDDNSPDGTGAILDRLSAADSRVLPIHRPKKLGLGTAHRMAMRYAMENGYDALITMDADFSHPVGLIPDIIAYLENYDFCIGSRYCKGGKTNYTGLRLFISKVANYMARYLLGLPTYECTTSFRGFRTSLLQRMEIDRIRSSGYSFFVESLVQVCRHTNSIKEFPIHFEDRQKGKSKISSAEIVKAVLNIFRLSIERPFRRRLLPMQREAAELPLARR